VNSITITFQGYELLFCDVSVKLFYLHTPYWKLSQSGSGYYLRCSKAEYKEKQFARVLLNLKGNLVVDHINGNTLDNRLINLRICTKSQNAMNSKARTDLPKGVSWDKQGKRFRAKIQVNGTQLNLGSFETKEKAEIAYLKAAAILFKEFALHVSRPKP